MADILYLEVARQLQAAGMQLLNNLALLSPNISQPPPDFMSAEGLQQLLQQHSDGPSSSSSSSLVSPAVADAVVSYLASTFEGGDARMMDAAAPPVTPLSVDRLQVGGSSSTSDCKKIWDELVESAVQRMDAAELPVTLLRLDCLQVGGSSSNDHKQYHQ